MTKLEDTSTDISFDTNSQIESFASQESTLRTEVDKALRRYFVHLEDEPITDLHQMVMSEVEAPLLEAVMRYNGNNQSKASTMLGLNRGTLRTKLKHYGLL